MIKKRSSLNDAMSNRDKIVFEVSYIRSALAILSHLEGLVEMRYYVGMQYDGGLRCV